MGVFDFLKAGTPNHPRFGAMKFARGYWRCEADYLAAGNVSLMLGGDKKAVHPSALAMCDSLEARFDDIKAGAGKALYEESYKPVREAIDVGEYPKFVGDDIPTIPTPDEVWNHLRPVWVMFEAGNGPDYIMVAVKAEWEVEHLLGIGIRNWEFDKLNGSVIAP